MIIRLENWCYPDWFAKPLLDETPVQIIEAERMIKACGIKDHPFFKAAGLNPELLKLWVSQEIIITNPFAQLLHFITSMCENVHVRAMLDEVASGEHGSLNPESCALSSHPWYLHKLRESVGVIESDIKPLPELKEFINYLSSECTGLLSGIGALGVGNERLLIPEYTAIKRSFKSAIPDADYKTFLDANISEDWQHYILMRTAATHLINNGADGDEYLTSATTAVARRLEYYDKLLLRDKS